MYQGDVDTHPDEVHHLGVGTSPLGCERLRHVLIGHLRLLPAHAVNRVYEWGEVLHQLVCVVKVLSLLLPLLVA